MSRAALNPFLKGVYTVLAADEWGQIVILHFDVIVAVISSLPSFSSYSSTVTTFSTSISNSSLELRLDLQVRSNPSGLTISVDEFNLRDTTNNVTAADEWRYSSIKLNPFYPCHSPDLAAGVAIFRGYYAENNFSQGIPLELYSTTLAYTCPISFPPDYYLFESLSSKAIGIITEPGPFHGAKTDSVTYFSLPVTGYWTGGAGTANPVVFNHLPPGTYTVIAADEWGRVLLLHFAWGSDDSWTCSLQVSQNSDILEILTYLLQ